MLTPKNWRFRPIDESVALRLTSSLGITLTLGRLLAGRGFTDPDLTRRFLTADLDHLHDPDLLPDIRRAARRIAEAVSAEEPLLIHGDYDVDGVCSASVLTRGLKALGGKVSVHVPHRHHDGYDLQAATVEEAHRNGIRLIVTTDCGIQAIPAVERAKELGIDVVITDHHEPGPVLPDALAVVDPRRADSIYPFPAICGTTVAFKVLQAVVRELGQPEAGLFRAFLDIVSIATIADMMPLMDENREIVRYGLQYLARTQKPGLRALLGNVMKDRATITAEDVAFQIGPRINAVGRMGDAKVALELLLCTDFARGRLLAQEMEAVNLYRRQEQDRIFKEADSLLHKRNLEEAKILILSGDTWHTGLIGPVASRMVEAYRKPAILIAHDGEVGRGSARTVGGFQLMTALESCRDLMERCGGHQQAAGFDLPVNNLAAFEERMMQIAAESVTADDLDAALEIDAAIPPSEIHLGLCRELAMLEPYGHGHPAPLFASRFTVIAGKQMGRSGAHLKLIVRGEGLDPTEAVFWRQGDALDCFTPGEEILMCYRLGINQFQGRQSVQLEAVDVKSAAAFDLPYQQATADPFVI